MIRNYAVNISYNGTHFCGYQLQPNCRTVAGEIRKALGELCGTYTDLAGCSRTDSGVHANDYCFSFKTEKDLSPVTIKKALNNKLPPDIRVITCKCVPDDFHARYSVKAKEYMYVIHNDDVESPFYSDFSLFYTKDLDIEKLNEVALLFVGEHDFSAFRAVGSKDVDPVRMIYSARFERKGDIVIFRICGNGFLYKMVRLIVGSLLKVSENKLTSDDIKEMLKDGKSRCPYTADAKGLFLSKVFYE